jgi:hypothetical protein
MEKGNEALNFGKQKLLELKQYAEEGKFSWRMSGFTAGIAIIILSFLSITSDLISLSPFRAVLNVYLMLFGAAACMLEFKEKAFTQKYLDILKREALFLYRPYGRAAFYFFIGILIVSHGGFLGLLIGGYVTFVGAAIYYSSKKAFSELDKLRGSITEKEIESQFLAFDKDQTGFLESSELANLCRSLGAQLTATELESALFILDRNDDGKISLEEFKNWWYNKSMV